MTDHPIKMKRLPETAIKIEIDQVFIYALVDPRYKSVKYIGQTSQLQTRFKSHMLMMSRNQRFCGWIRRLSSIELEPDLYVLECVDENTANEREKFWIEYFGIKNLYNKAKPSFKRSRYYLAKETDKTINISDKNPRHHEVKKLECWRCGHNWIPRIEDVRLCPKCKNPFWYHKIKIRRPTKDKP